MCLDCGCGEPNEKHGDNRHITMDQLTAAAQASGISVAEAARNIQEGVASSVTAPAGDPALSGEQHAGS
jgi:hypothetical protein